MTATIKDVARRAGVSIATVSHVLNNTQYVNPELRERVGAAVRELGYRRNLAARSLRAGRTNLLGLMVADLAAPSFPLILRGVQDIAFSAGYHLVLLESRCRNANEPAPIMRQGILDGLLVVIDGREVNNVAMLCEPGIPQAIISSRVGPWDANTIVVDEAAGADLAVRHLIGLGHQRIGFMGGPPNSQAAMLRHEGFQQALARYGLAYTPAMVAETTGSRYGGYRGAKRLLATKPQPTALVVASDILAAGALLAVREAGLRIPNDVSLVCYDEMHIAELTTPTLTTISLPWYESGLQATKLLLERVDGHDEGPRRTITLGPKLTRRQSTMATATQL